LTEISFIQLKDTETSAFVKLGRRKALAVSRISSAVILEIEGGIVTNARVSVGAAFPVQRRIKGAEKLLEGRWPDDEAIKAAGREAAREMLFITGERWSTEYKEPAVGTIVERCIKQALVVE